MLYRIAQAIMRIVTKVCFFLTVENKDAVPETGGCVICANHRSFWDGILIAVAVRRPMAYIAKEELFRHKMIAFFMRKFHCYPVRRGGGDIAIVKTAISLLRQGEVLVIFPEGTRVKSGEKVDIKSGAIRLAAMTGVPLVPAGIFGNFRLFQKMRVRFGKPIAAAACREKRMTDEEYTEEMKKIMQTVYSLAETE